MNWWTIPGCSCAAASDIVYIDLAAFSRPGSSRIDPIHFVARWRKRKCDPGLSFVRFSCAYVCSFHQLLFSCFVLSLGYICISFWFLTMWLAGKIFSEMTYSLSCELLNPTILYREQKKKESGYFFIASRKVSQFKISDSIAEGMLNLHIWK